MPMPASIRRAARAAVGVVLATQMSQQPSVGAAVDASAGTTPYLVISIQSLSPTGPGGAEASPSWPLSPDAIAAPTVGAGSAEFADLCAASAGGAAFQPGTRVAWRVEGRLISRDADGARVWIRWSRMVMDRTLVEVDDLVREYETRLIEGEKAVIDLIRPRTGTGAPDCDGVVVKMWLELRDAPQLANRVLDYDIWLVHREADGREVLDRMTGRGLQGRDVDYLFKHLRYDASGLPDPAGPIDVEVRGAVKGRARLDGRIDLSLRAARMTVKRGLGNGENGSKQATINDGETLEIEMPPTRERGPGFEAQRTAIRVTVRRVS
jgi:hypothetical protein